MSRLCKQLSIHSEQQQLLQLSSGSACSQVSAGIISHKWRERERELHIGSIGEISVELWCTGSGRAAQILEDGGGGWCTEAPEEGRGTP